MANLLLFLPGKLLDELMAAAKATGEPYNKIVTDALRLELERRPRHGATDAEKLKMIRELFHDVLEVYPGDQVVSLIQKILDIIHDT